MPANSATIALYAPDPETTEAIGKALAQRLVPGDIVLLSGGLGAGKSALARAIIRARLGTPHLAVPSPSFAIVQPYEGIIHADLYRLAHEDELFELGLFDDPQAIMLVEWPERAPALKRQPGVAIALEIPKGGEGRSIGISPTGGKSIADWVAPLSLWVAGKGKGQ